jgi:hypothetical protein
MAAKTRQTAASPTAIDACRPCLATGCDHCTRARLRDARR